eukprot:EG_transcript_22677
MPKYAPDFWRNNYLDMSSAGGGDAVWQTMGATAKPAAEGQAAGSSAYDTYKGLLSLAKTHAAAAGQVAATKGTCKRCGATGHLTFQCRNHMRPSGPDRAAESSGKAMPERWEMPSSTSSVSSEEEKAPDADSDVEEKAKPPDGLRGRGGAQFQRDEQYYAPRRPPSPPPPRAAVPDDADGTEVVFIPEPLKRRRSSSSSSDDGSSGSSGAARRKKADKAKKGRRSSGSSSSSASESSSSSSSGDRKRRAKKRRRKEKKKAKKSKEKKKRKKR